MSDQRISSAETPYEVSRVLSEEQETYLSGLLTAEINDVLSGSVRSDFLDNIQEWRQLVRFEPKEAEKSYPWAKASNVVVPVLGQKHLVITSKLTAAFAVKKPFWDVQVDDYAFIEAANAIGRYFDFISTAPFHLNLGKISRAIFYDLCLTGTQIVRVPWLYEETNIKTEEGARKRVTHNGPAIVPVRLEDFLMRPIYSDIQKAPWVGNLVWLTAAELRQRAALGVYENIEAILDSPATSLDGNWSNELERRGLSATVQNAYEETRLYPIFEGYIFYDSDGDGNPEDLKVWFEPSTGTFLRTEFNTLGARDIVAINYIEVPNQIYGIGLGHTLFGSQKEIDFLHNLRNDALHLALLPAFKRQIGTSKKEKLNISPASVIPVSSMEELEPFVIPDTSISSYNAEGLARDYADKVSGANDPMAGFADSVLKSGGNGASTMFLANQGSTILDAVFEGVEEGFASVGQIILMQLVANKHRVDFSVLNREDAALLQQVLSAAPETLATTFRFKVSTTDKDRTEVAQQQNLQNATSLYAMYGQQMIPLLQLIQNPQVPPALQQFGAQLFMGSTRFVRQLLIKYKIEGVDEILPPVGGDANDGRDNFGSNAATGRSSGGTQPGTDGMAAPQGGTEGALDSSGMAQ